jgi:DNA-binding transcriptional regulator YdaS (Cro superfamily)
MQNENENVKTASALLGGQSALAKVIGCTAPTVNQWVKRHRPVPRRFAVAIERATGGKVTRQNLRPDDYWLIWPDLPAPQTPAATSCAQSSEA